MSDLKRKVKGEKNEKTHHMCAEARVLLCIQVADNVLAFSVGRIG